MAERDPKPEILRLEELALLVKGGDIKLPRFQRPFVWRRSDMLKLLDSIYKGYPIGSLLLWNSSQRLTSERSIAGLDVDTSGASLYPTNYLLDGQQRLTTLCGALFWKGEPANSIWAIHFDLETEKFLYPDDPNLVTIFPLNKLIDTSDFLMQCMKFAHHPSRQKYISRAERLLRTIKDYKVAVVKIGDMSLEEVAPIFERINSTGRKLTMVDLMMAATWSGDFDLSVEINLVRKACEDSGFSGLTDQAILRSIAAAANLGINKDDIQKLRSLKPEDLKKAADEAKRSLVSASKILQQHANIFDAKHLPYGLQLTYIGEFFRLCGEPTEALIAEVVSWFWYTSVTSYFRGANTGQNSKDLLRVRQFARLEVDHLYVRQDTDITSLLFDKFSLRNASSTTFALLLKSVGPACTLTGLKITHSHYRAPFNQTLGVFAPEGLQQLNISRVIEPYSSEAVAMPQPNVELRTHLLSTETVEAVRENDSYKYRIYRAGLISQHVSRLIGCKVLYKPTDQMVGDYLRELGGDFLGADEIDNDFED